MKILVYKQADIKIITENPGLKMKLVNFSIMYYQTQTQGQRVSSAHLRIIDSVTLPTVHQN